MSADRRISVLLAVVVFVGMLHMVAPAAQSGDGMETVTAAVMGGVLHPPGFPLQAWLDRIVVGALPIRPASAIALLCLLGHALSAFFLAEALRVMRASTWIRMIAPLFFLLFPSVWALAVQPEVFSLAFACMAAVLAQSVLLALEPGQRTTRHALLLGLLVGLSGAQHAMTVVAAPAFLTSAALLLVEKETRAKHFASMALAFLVVFGGLYASLPMLRRENPWPDWGHLASARDVVRHMLREEFGTFDLAASVEGETFYGIRIAAEDLASHLHVLLVALVVGAVVVVKRSKALAVALVGTLLVATAFLVQARMGPSLGVARAYLERFEGLFVLPAALLIGLAGAHFSTRKEVPAVFALCAVLMIARGHAHADASESTELEVFRSAVGAQVRKEALFFERSELLTFGGVPTTEGLRFPIAGGLLPLPWYVRDVVSHVEPRLRSSDPQPIEAAVLVEFAVKRGYTVMSTDPQLFERVKGHVQLQGVFFVAHPSEVPPVGPRSVVAALELCPHAAELPAHPPGHPFLDEAYTVFARGFDGAARFLDESGRSEDAAIARRIAHELVAGTDPGAWIKGCEVLLTRLSAPRP